MRKRSTRLVVIRQGFSPRSAAPIAQAGTLDLAAGCTYTLDSGSYGNGYDGLPIITAGSTISGNGATITRDIAAPAFRLIEVGNGGSLTADYLTLSDGEDNDGGGAGILNDGTLSLSNSTLADNSGNTSGAGIYNEGTLTLLNSTIAGNNAGAHTMAAGSSTAETLTITNSTIADNTAGSAGAGIAGAVTLTNSIVANNGGQNCSGPVTDHGYNLDSDGTCDLNASTDSPR